MAYYKNKRTFIKIVLNGVVRYAKLSLTSRPQDTPETTEQHVTNSVLFMNEANVTDNILNVTSEEAKVTNDILYL